MPSVHIKLSDEGLGRRGSPTPLALAAILAERLDHGLGIPVDDRQQHAGRPVGNPASLFHS